MKYLILIFILSCGGADEVQVERLEGDSGKDSTVPGPTGESTTGEAGPRGSDSTVPGPRGERGSDSNVPGSQGKPGERGSDGTSIKGDRGRTGRAGKDAQPDRWIYVCVRSSMVSPWSTDSGYATDMLLKYFSTRSYNKRLGRCSESSPWPDEDYFGSDL